MRKEITIKNQIGELERVNQFLEEIASELGLDMELQMNLNLGDRACGRKPRQGAYLCAH